MESKMNLNRRSLLTGLALSFLAVSGAQAANKVPSRPLLFKRQEIRANRSCFKSPRRGVDLVSK